MKPQVILHLLGTLLKLLGLLQVIPGIVSAAYGEISGVIAFGLSALLTLMAGIALERRGVEGDMGTKEGFALVAFGWLAAALFGALPYVFLGVSPVDALFESMSGFTTTGASILTEYSADGYWLLNATAANQSLAYSLGWKISNLSFMTGNATLNSTLNTTLNSTLDSPAGYSFAGLLKSNSSILWNNTTLLGNETGLWRNATYLLRNVAGIPAFIDIGSHLSIKGTFFGLLFWRSFTQWLGGMGIILLFIAILPRLGVAGRQLFRAEVPGPEKDSLTPRIRQTAKILWGVYVVLSGMEVMFLLGAGMGLYDSLCHTFATMATGGFSPRAESIGFYNSGLIDAIVIAFMFLAGANFALHYKMIYEDRRCLIRDTEFRFYAFIIVLATVIIMIWGGMNGSLTAAGLEDGHLLKLRFAIFQVVSIMTTTGFATIDFDQWSSAGRLTLFILMFVGACAGSTGGSIKVVRFLLALKYAYRDLFRALHPKVVIPIKLGDNIVREEILHSSMVFVIMYLMIFAAATLMLALVSPLDITAMAADNMSTSAENISAMSAENMSAVTLSQLDNTNMITIASAVAATLGNVGPGFGQVGPTLNFAFLHPVGKMILFFCMWLGRLEIVTALMLLVPEFWKR